MYTGEKHNIAEHCGTCAHKKRTSNGVTMDVTWKCYINNKKIIVSDIGCEYHSGLTKKGYELYTKTNPFLNLWNKQGR